MGFRELAARLPEWGRLFDEQAHAAFREAVDKALRARGQPFELHQDYARLLGPGPHWDLPLFSM